MDALEDRIRKMEIDRASSAAKLEYIRKTLDEMKPNIETISRIVPKLELVKLRIKYLEKIVFATVTSVFLLGVQLVYEFVTSGVA